MARQVGLPAGHVHGFSAQPAKQRCNRDHRAAEFGGEFVQAAPARDLAALSQMATGPLLEELRTQLAERGPAPNHTEVVRIEARLLAVETVREAQVASVEFSGLIREEEGAHARPFRELWMLARLQDSEPGWRVARVQALS